MNGLQNNSGPSRNLVQTALDDLLNEAMLSNAREGRASAEDPVIFTQSTADNAAVISSALGGGTYFDGSTDDYAAIKDAPIAAFASRISQVVNYNKNVPISRTFMEDQQLDAVTKTIQMQAKTWTATRDRAAMQVYALGFTTQTTSDNVALFSNSHLSLAGTTVDNLETGVLSDTNLNTLVVSLRNQPSQTGVLLGYEPDFLLVPNALGQTGMAVTKSVLRAGTGNNDLNYWSELYPGMKVSYNQFLDTTSSTAYFIGSKGHSLTRWVREGLSTTLVPWQYSGNDAYVYKMRAREVVDVIEYNGLAASSGTV